LARNGEGSEQLQADNESGKQKNKNVSDRRIIMNLIVAADKNWGIGKDNKLLVSIPSDMKFFRQETMGKVVVMGRKTLESFPNGLPLKNRTNVVLTSDKNYQVKDAVIVHSIDEVLEELKKYDDDEIYVIGGGKVYEELEEELTVNPPEVDFDALKAINDDVVGWLELEAIPSISYPIAQGEDNEYYLHRTIKKTYNFAGSVFIDSTNASDFSDCNTIIYGHNMKNGSMFNNIKSYTDQSFADEHPYVYIYLPDGTVSQYKVVVGHIISESSVLYSTQIVDTASFVQEMVKTSSIKVDFDQSQVQSVITLSTCTSAGSESGKRNVVHAILQRKGIDPVKEKMEN